MRYVPSTCVTFDEAHTTFDCLHGNEADPVEQIGFWLPPVLLLLGWLQIPLTCPTCFIARDHGVIGFVTK